MEFLKDRRTLLALIGGALALLAGVVIATMMVGKGRNETAPPPPASQGGLVVETGYRTTADGSAKACGRPVCRRDHLAECAQRNGVATGALDVGVDPAGNLAAADQAGTMLTPLPPQLSGDPGPDGAGCPVQAPPPRRWAGRKLLASWRWRLSRSDAQRLCPDPVRWALGDGRATYGRWMQQTPRLVPGKVEVSGDNRSFRPLAEQASNCSIQPVG